MVLTAAIIGVCVMVTTLATLIAIAGFVRRSPKFPRSTPMRSLAVFGLASALLAVGPLCAALGRLFSSSLYVVGLLIFLAGLMLKITDPGPPFATVRRPTPYPKVATGGWSFRRRRTGR